MTTRMVLLPLLTVAAGCPTTPPLPMQSDGTTEDVPGTSSTAPATPSTTASTGATLSATSVGMTEPETTSTATATATTSPTATSTSGASSSSTTGSSGSSSSTGIDAPLGMIEIEGGDFEMGSAAGSANELPVLDEVCLETFWIDEHEVTVAEYFECWNDAGCPAPATGGGCNWSVGGRDDHPVNCVTWFSARDYCVWAEKRLPTEAEWELAARGLPTVEDSDGRTYPWGDTPAPDCDHAIMNELGGAANTGCGDQTTAEVGSVPMGATPEGVQDMGGNVWEWTANLEWTYDPEAQCPLMTDPGDNTRRVLRGGAWSHLDTNDFRSSRRNPTNPNLEFDTFGFRCAWSPER